MMTTTSHQRSSRFDPKLAMDPVPTRFGPARLLVADDEHLVATGIVGYGRDLGHTVVAVASDGEMALAMAREHRPDMALLDIQMPRMTGIEVAKALHEEMNIPSIIISAYSDAEHLHRIHSQGSASGIFGYLLKPVGREDLRVAIAVAQQRNAIDDYHVTRIGQLERSLANRRLVEQAKWLLVQSQGMSEPEAHERLQKIARDRRARLAEVAQIVIDTGRLPH